MQKYNNISNRTSYSGVIPIPKNPDNCFIFPQEFEYRLNDIYSIQNFRYYTTSNFCLTKNNGKLQVSEVIGVSDSQGIFTKTCSDKGYGNHRGFWYELKQFF
ncbi:Uncharacterised protein [Moraxella lacunata]|uniref:Uncharacterized protein n=1 Tax=Moraxella lacunata TaxID=477 RepID=A0A378QH87_MORLA|nr:Uncharacterised protein [Moraxella lacunata]